MDTKLKVGATGDTYASLELATAFYGIRPDARWTAASDLDRSAGLVRATDYIDATYRLAVTDTLNPVIAKATMALAVEMLTAVTIKADNRSQIEQTDILDGVGETSVKWAPTAAPVDPYPYVSAMIAPAVVPTNPSFGTIRLVR